MERLLQAGPLPSSIRRMTSLDHYLRLALRSRSLTDREFDCVYPVDVRAASRRFWTPLAVAWRVASGLDQLRATRVLDVGSGSGKFCVAAAAQAPGIAFVGIEHRPHLVETARDVSARMQTSNACFSVGDATLTRFDDFDALYLFNPFEENTFDNVEQIDGTVELTFDRYMNDIQRVCTALASARIGTIVVTYHGFGARLPHGYKLLSAEPIGSDRVCFWRKASGHADTRTRALAPSRASDVYPTMSVERSTTPTDDANAETSHLAPERRAVWSSAPPRSTVE